MTAQPPRISFIIPAYNEAKLIGPTLESLARAVSSLGLFAERLVVDDASTDHTAQVAAEAGARVIHVNCRQIAAVRNAGAKAARGEVLFFVDADTTVAQETIQQAMEALDHGAVGGGAPFGFSESAPWPAHLAVWSWNRTSRLMHWMAGCFIFVLREVFEQVGGFDERYFASEELHLSRALKKQGRLTIVDHPVHTSARKLRLFSQWTHFTMLSRFLLTRGRSMHRREELDLWYDGSREA